VDDIKGKYDPSKHPDVIAGKRSGDEILRSLRLVSLALLTSLPESSSTPSMALRRTAR
jgi:hypothetical protein